MHTLRRTVRLVVNPAATTPTPPNETRGRNGYAGKPAMTGLGAFYELEVACRGEPDAATGYLIDIKVIDNAARGVVAPRIEAGARTGGDPAAILAGAMGPLAAALRPVELDSARLRLSPYYAVEMSTDNGQRVLIRQRFDFAAAHRLHVETLSDDENRRLFGKCNNPSGHGHNYQIEPCVECDPADPIDLAQLEAIVEEVVIERFDHKHLNIDTDEFNTEKGGVNPSVENIARVSHELLSGPVASAGARLVSTTVWETDRTAATYAPRP
ncbi:MAG: 6-carboxytetrahydropterin synthase [Planctomycetota bacterium]